MNRLVVSDKYNAVEFGGHLITLHSDGRFTIGLIGTQISPTSNELVDAGYSPEDNREMFVLPLDVVDKKMRLADAEEKAKDLSGEFSIVAGSKIYVPTIKELERLYIIKDSLGLAFKDATYLSSTLNESDCVHTINFADGFKGVDGPNIPKHVVFIMR